MSILIRTTSRTAFTLTELMISIALALLLIIGVNVVFKATSDTLSAGQAVAQANRNEQAMHTVLADDMRSLVLPEEAPFLFIRSQRRAGFINQDDLDNDEDFDGSEASALTFDHDADPSTPEASFSPAIYNHRNHRIDTLGFFARGRFYRQTGANPNELIADAVSSEAYIWYGHTKKPNYNESAPDITGFARYGPAEDTLDNNPENWFVEDWTLGRVVLLLNRLENGQASYRDGTPMSVGFIQRKVAADDSRSAAPLSVNSEDTSGDWKLQWSRFDAAGTTFQEYRRILGNFIEDPTNDPWFDAVSDFRFHYSPIVKRPLEPDTIARAVPGLMDGTSQFLVEFAGDFVTQETTGSNAGRITAPVPDGIVDFVVLDPGGANEERRMRWYGMPRDIDGDGIILARPQAGGGSNELVDVVPVTAVMAADGHTPIVPPERWFERTFNQVPPPLNYYAHPTASPVMPTDAIYIAAWGPDTIDQPKPQYIRFIIGATPIGTNSEGRVAEYVFKLK